MDGIQSYSTPTIAYPGSSAGGSPQAMPRGTVGHRRGISTHRGAGIRDPQGGLPSPPAALGEAFRCAGIATLRAPNRRTRQAVVGVPYVGFHPLASSADLMGPRKVRVRRMPLRPSCYFEAGPAPVALNLLLIRACASRISDGHNSVMFARTCLAPARNASA